MATPLANILDNEGGIVRATPEDRARARELMHAQRHEDGRVGKSSGRFNYKDANPVLDQIAMGTLRPPATLGLVQELFDNGASVRLRRPKTSNIFKKLAGNAHAAEPSSVLLHAARHCPDDVFRLMVRHAGADFGLLDLVLPVAIQHDDAARVALLLDAGANAAGWCQAFLAAVQSGSPEMVQVMLREVGGACPECRQNGLVRAATIGCPKKTQLLLDGGASPTQNDCAAFQEAVRGGRVEIVRMLFSHSGHRFPESILYAAAREARAKKHLDILDICLRTRDNGKGSRQHGQPKPPQSVRQWDGQTPQAAVLARDSEPGPFDSAIRSSSLDGIKAVLSAGPVPPTSLSVAWAKIDDIKGNEEFQHGAYNLLLDTGAIDISQQSDSLATAAASGKVNICDLLLRHTSTPEHFAGVAVSAAAKTLHFGTLQHVARFAVSNQAFNDGLIALLSGGSERWLKNRGLEIVHFLLERSDASVAISAEVAVAFCTAAKLYHRDAAELLATAVHADVLNQALVSALTAERPHAATCASDDDLLWLVTSLLGWGARGDAVDAAFIGAIGLRASEDVIDTFLVVGKMAVDVNTRHREGLMAAIRNGDSRLMETLLVSSGPAPTPETTARAYDQIRAAQLESGVADALVEGLARHSGGAGFDLMSVRRSESPRTATGTTGPPRPTWPYHVGWLPRGTRSNFPG